MRSQPQTAKLAQDRLTQRSRPQQQQTRRDKAGTDVLANNATCYEEHGTCRQFRQSSQPQNKSVARTSQQPKPFFHDPRRVTCKTTHQSFELSHSNRNRRRDPMLPTCMHLPNSQFCLDRCDNSPSSSFHTTSRLLSQVSSSKLQQQKALSERTPFMVRPYNTRFKVPVSHAPPLLALPSWDHPGLDIAKKNGA